MDFNQLRCFITLAEELHFGKAAEKLYLSQPALSRQIQTLEAELKIQLFDRTSRRVQLTLAGEKFLETALLIVMEGDRGIQIAKQIARSEKAQLKIGFTNSALHNIVPSILTKYRQVYPDVKLILSSGGTENLVAALCSREIDIGFLYPPLREKSIATEAVSEESFLVVLPETHQLAKLELVSVKSLANEPLILYPRSLAPVMYAQFIETFQQHRIDPNIVQEVQMAHTRIGLVAAGIGISFIFSSLQSLKIEGVVYRPLKEDFPKLKLAVAWRKADLSPILPDFLTLTLKHKLSC